MMKVNDLASFYQNLVQSQTIMEILRIIKKAYPDDIQFDPSHVHYDSRCSKKKPRWFMVNVKFKEDIVPPITRNEIKDIPELRIMVLFRNPPLSLQPVTQKKRRVILDLRA